MFLLKELILIRFEKKFLSDRSFLFQVYAIFMTPFKIGNGFFVAMKSIMKMHKSQLKYTLLVSTIFFLLSIIGCSPKKQPVKSTKVCVSDSMSKIITFDTIKLIPLVQEIKLTGKVTFNEDKVVKVFPPVGGIVEDLKVSLGDRVEKGQILARIKSSDMAGYASQYSTALANLSIAKKEMETTKDLADAGIAPQKDYLEAKQNYEIALAEVVRTKRVANILGDSTQAFYDMRAPISGFIIEKKVSEGTTLRPDNGDNAFTISNLKEVWVVGNVFESDLKNIKSGDSVEVYTMAYDKPYKGTIQKVAKTIDPITKASQVRVIIDNPDYRLQPEMFARVMVKGTNANIKLPAIHNDSYVFEENNYFVVTYKGTCDMKVLKVLPYNMVGNTLYLQQDAPIGTRIIRKHQLLFYSQLNNNY